MDDKTLINKFRDGDGKAFTTLFDRYSQKLKNTLMSKNSFIREDEAEDYVTEAFISFHENLLTGKYEDKGKLFNYLYTIAYNLYRKQLRKNAEDVTKDPLEILAGEIFEDGNEREEMMAFVEQILLTLTVGKNEKVVNCADLIYAQYGILKISDEDYYNEHPEKFTNILDVRRKRNKCMEKLRKIVKENINKI